MCIKLTTKTTSLTSANYFEANYETSLLPEFLSEFGQAGRDLRKDFHHQT